MIENYKGIFGFAIGFIFACIIGITWYLINFVIALLIAIATPIILALIVSSIMKEENVSE